MHFEELAEDTQTALESLNHVRALMDALVCLIDNNDQLDLPKERIEAAYRAIITEIMGWTEHLQDELRRHSTPH